MDLVIKSESSKQKMEEGTHPRLKAKVGRSWARTWDSDSMHSIPSVIEPKTEG